MKLIDKFSERELYILKNANIKIEDKDYNVDELIELEDKVSDVMLDSLDKKQNFTALAEEYENILNLVITLEDK